MNSTYYKKLDEQINFQYKDEIYDKVWGLNFGCYRYVSEYVYVSYYINGESIKSIGDVLGLCVPAVRRWTEKWGFKLRKRGGNHNKKTYNLGSLHKQITRKSMWSSNATWTKIGETRDTHITKEQADCVCKSLLDDYGGLNECPVRGICTNAWVEKERCHNEIY